ncbi:nose resistant to fluoxetine protein 6-like [Panulirus ornatus]|uniref:nose resistant to fluoxetine protein 6-like n=1 Tax=Panulirus ornatus TaxID=150431 RepID=UPI003A8BDD74
MARMLVTMLTVTATVTVWPAEGVTIPAHRPDLVTNLRWLLGRHYYPTETPNSHRDDLAASVCLAHSALTLASTHTWSYTMWDASGKLSDGVSVGGTEAVGHPGLCQSVDVSLAGTLASHLVPYQPQLASHNLTLQGLHPEALLQQNTILRGKYCLITVRDVEEDGGGATGGSWQIIRSLAGRFQHTYATCVPDSCSSQFLQESLERQQEVGTTLSVTCHDDDPHLTWTSHDLSFLWVTLMLVTLAATATLLEVRRPCSATAPATCRCSPGLRLLHCFSVSQNWKRLTSYSTADAHLQTLDGLRVVNTVWVVAAHRYMLFLTSAANPSDILQHMGDWHYWWVFNAYPSVDTFFFISAFLVSIFLKKRIQEFTFTSFYLQRYLRLAPTMMYVTLGSASILRYLGSGPVWMRTYQALFGRPCANTAWTNLLFINNFNDSNDMCMGHLWSLAVEWQLYVLAPLLLVPLYRCSTWRLRWLPLASCLVLSILMPAIITVLYDLPPTATFWDHRATQLYYNMYYVVPWCRAGPYLVGLAAGSLYHWMNEHNLMLAPECMRVWGGVCSAVVVAVLVAPTYLTGQGSYWAALYSSLARPAWGAALAFFVINAFKGQPGVVAWFFSRPVFAPLCRLSYCMFLVSLPLQTLAATRPHKLHYDHLTAVYLVVGDLGLSYAASLVLTLLVEAPFARLFSLTISGKIYAQHKVPKTTTSKMRQEEPKRTSSTQELLKATLSSSSNARYRNI